MGGPTRRSVLATVVALVGATAGCGGNTGEDDTATTPEQTLRTTSARTDRATATATRTATETPTETPTDTETPTQTETEAPPAGLAIEVPESSAVDEAVDLRITGADPGESVTLRSAFQDDDGATWSATATFEADDEGVVEVGTQGSDPGAYGEGDPMGWIWAATPESDLERPFSEGDEMAVTLSATVERGTLTRTVDREVEFPDVEVHEIESDDVVGYAFEPAGEGPHPGVLVLHGAGGNPMYDRARYLASHGYATAALKYFGKETTLPDYLMGVPLEYFDSAASWLRGRSWVRDGPVGVHGHSRGGELALLLGTRFDWVGAVVSYAGSGVAWSATQATNTSSWTHEGDPIPFLEYESSAYEYVDGAKRLRGIYAKGLSNASEKRRKRATIAVEETNAPLLLVSGGDDQLWPSKRLSEIAIDRLNTADVEFPYEHRTFPEAGHFVEEPYVPTANRRTIGNYLGGGSQAGYAEADPSAWEGTLATLEKGLRG